MSHELRTPLNAIIGFADLIQAPSAGAAEPGKSTEYASYISQGGRDLLKILNDILDLSRIEIDNFELNLERHSIRDLIETRSEERRVGKECRDRWWTDAENKKR